MKPRSSYLDQERSSGRGVDIDWLAGLAPVFTSDLPVVRGTTQTIWASRNFVLSHSICEHADLVARPFVAGGRVLDHLGFCLVLNGAVQVEVGSASTSAEAGDILLLDLRQPMRLTFGVHGGMTSALTLWVPRARLPAQLSGLSELHGLLAKASTPAIAVAAAPFRALLTQLDIITVEEMDELVAGLVVLVGHAIGLCAATKASEPKEPAPLDTLVTLCRYIEDNLTARDLGAEKLAATFGLSRASLYRLFEPVGGVASFIRERRLARAHHELTMPGLQNRRIGPIAYQAGFHSITAFNRVFRAAYGETPRNVRKRKSGFTPTSRRLEEIGILARWLLETAA
jgi:AraC-like DNA-binding protein